MGVYILMSKPSTLDASQTAGVALEYDTVWADRSLIDEGLGRPSPSSPLLQTCKDSGSLGLLSST